MAFFKKVFFTGLAFLFTLTGINSLSATPLSAAPLNVIPLSAAPLSAILLSCMLMNNQKCKVRPQIVNVNSDESLFYPFSIKTSKCNNINNPYAKLCVPDVVKKLNVKVFNLMSSKELIDKGVCDKGSIWNPSSWEYECDKSCGVGEYADYEKCKCRKRLVDKMLKKQN